ncbi:LytTR family DNA-binding domain-containing protein [Rhabdobacter roseus]|uniref:DNA-binding LytR/AlgR family response regulator n=1 Tax=Rhabdobacter roseus TaxID=1655419 RepID=A0A840THN2_9BACT|nr:LytTR family DNA-binding domain-containing protein [Rhabdobacter roseus]MBB5282974.1 DNA-binding LytR/AlgR family response regulator [Rhabdobacter roseus]
MKKDLFSSLRCLVVDDEPKAQQALARLISEMSWLELLGCCSNVPQALEIIVNHRPDIIFLDVEMPGLTGLDLLKSLPPPRPHVILVTAYKEYALDAFEYDVTDFLLKPVSWPRFIKTILKISVKHQPHFPDDPVAGESEDSPGERRAPAGTGAERQGYAWLRSDKKFHRIPHQHIYALVALKDYVKIYYTEGMLLVRENLGGMEERLPDTDFVRIHRSCIVNRHAVKTIEGNMVKMIDGSEYLIADRLRREMILRLLTR